MSLRDDLENLPGEVWQNEYVKIKPLSTLKDLIYAGYDCQLKEEQKELVSPFWFYIGRAYLFKEDNYPCIICNASDEPIGFINFAKWVGNGDAYTWGFYIDKKYQGKGNGKHAAQLAISILKSANPQKQIKLSTEVSNTKAHALYTSMGFKKLPEMDGDDIVFGL